MKFFKMLSLPVGSLFLKQLFLALIVEEPLSVSA